MPILSDHINFLQYHWFLECAQHRNFNCLWLLTNASYLKCLLQCRLGECFLFCLPKGCFLLIVGCFIDEDWEESIVTIMQNILSIEGLENWVPRLQELEIFILREIDDLMLYQEQNSRKVFHKASIPPPTPPSVVSSDELETILAGDETVVMSTVTVGWLIADFLGVWYVIILRSLYYSSRQLGDQRTQGQGKNILTSEIFLCLAVLWHTYQTSQFHMFIKPPVL